MIKTAPLRGAAGRHLRRPPGLGEAPAGAHRPSACNPPLISAARLACNRCCAVPSSSAIQCPAPGRRLKGAFGVARDRFATLDPATVSQGSAPVEEDGEE